jgi:hypothetical protein
MHTPDHLSFVWVVLLPWACICLTRRWSSVPSRDVSSNGGPTGHLPHQVSTSSFSYQPAIVAPQLFQYRPGNTPEEPWLTLDFLCPLRCDARPPTCTAPTGTATSRGTSSRYDPTSLHHAASHHSPRLPACLRSQSLDLSPDPPFRRLCRCLRTLAWWPPTCPATATWTVPCRSSSPPPSRRAPCGYGPPQIRREKYVSSAPSYLRCLTGVSLQLWDSVRARLDSLRPNGPRALESSDPAFFIESDVAGYCGLCNVPEYVGRSAAAERPCLVILIAQMYPHRHGGSSPTAVPVIYGPACPTALLIPLFLHVIVVCSAVGLGARSCDQYETCAEMDVASEGFMVRYDEEPPFLTDVLH